MSPPPAPKKRKVHNLPQVLLDASRPPYLLDTQTLAASRLVSKGYLIHFPEDIAEVNCKDYLTELWILYNINPRNSYEEEYMRRMRKSIVSRFDEL